MLNYFRIKNILKYLTEEATKILALSLVIFPFDYCNCILYGITDREISKMRRIQNMSAKLVYNRGKFESSKQALYGAHWLPVKTRIKFKILTFMYNCSIG